MKTTDNNWKILTKYYRARFKNGEPIKLFNYIEAGKLKFYIWNN